MNRLSQATFHERPDNRIDNRTNPNERKRDIDLRRRLWARRAFCAISRLRPHATKRGQNKEGATPDKGLASRPYEEGIRRLCRSGRTPAWASRFCGATSYLGTARMQTCGGYSIPHFRVYSVYSTKSDPLKPAASSFGRMSSALIVAVSMNTPSLRGEISQSS